MQQISLSLKIKKKKKCVSLCCLFSNRLLPLHEENNTLGVKYQHKISQHLGKMLFSTQTLLPKVFQSTVLLFKKLFFSLVVNVLCTFSLFKKKKKSGSLCRTLLGNINWNIVVAQNCQTEAAHLQDRNASMLEILFGCGNFAFEMTVQIFD